MATPKISAMTFDGETWGGWSNAGGFQDLSSIPEAVAKIKDDPELGFRIIDADKSEIWVSEITFAERAIKSAKANFGADIPLSSVFIGYPPEQLTPNPG